MLNVESKHILLSISEKTMFSTENIVFVKYCLMKRKKKLLALTKIIKKIIENDVLYILRYILQKMIKRYGLQKILVLFKIDITCVSTLILT